MKTTERIFSILAVLLSIVSMIAAISTIGTNRIFTLDWSILRWVILAVLVFALFSLFLSSLLMMRSHRVLKIYLSYPFANKAEVSELRDLLQTESVYSLDNIQPGSMVSDLKKIIKRSDFCFFVVGKTQSPMQEKELAIMRVLGKSVYIILIDNEVKVPSALRDQIPLYINDENFKEQIETIINAHK